MMYVRSILILALLAGCGGPDFAAAHAAPTQDAPLQSAATPGAMPQSSPDDPAVSRLRTAIAEYREIAARGGWQPISSGSNLELGAQGPRVAALHRTLLVTGDLVGSANPAEQFDEQLAAAVRRFQGRHGLEPDGIVGAQTLAALNVPIERRLTTMALNLSRMQSEEQAWGARYVVVNAAAASYRLVEAGREVFERPAVVGRPGWPTPRVDGIIEALEFHPYWTVPPRIAALEIWPKVRRDAGYLRRNHMRVIDGQIRQDPGPDNPLGLVKFIFPNPYSVYLHDTDHPELFEQTKRFRSHGCVRISGALDLARLLLKGDADWPESRIADAIAGARNVRIKLASSIPIHITYRTAWVDDEGILQFRDDVYGRDRSEIAALPATSTAETCND
jgi:murein L,D-transpeptidase YcbB/YkuD